MAETESEADFIDRLYAVAMEPERFIEIVDIWQERLNSVSTNGFPLFDQETRHLDNHLNRAETLLSIVIDNEDTLPTPLVEKLNSESQAMAAIDEDGIIQAQNESAIQLYGAVEGESFKSLPFEREAIAAIKHELTELRQVGGGNVQRRLLPSSRTDNDQPVILSFAHWVTPSGRMLVLLKTVDFTWPAHLTPLVMEAFGLTEAEAEVMRLLVEGGTATGIAEKRGSSVATIRTQIRSIYAKTSTRNQSEFMRMAIGLTTLELADRKTLSGAFPETSEVPDPPFPRPEQRHLYELPDGRLLDYAEFGAPEGDPCLYFHSEYFGDVWSAHMVELATRANLRIIAPARPYCGRSTPIPKAVNSFDQANDDLSHLMDHLEIDRAVYVTQGVGGVFSVMFAHAHPERLTGIVSVAPMFPVVTPEDEKKMPVFAQFVSSIVNRHPRMLDFVARLALTYHNRVGSKRFLSSIFKDTPVDLAIVEDPKNLDAIIQGFQLCAANGYSGYTHDYRHLPKDRQKKWRTVQAPHVALLGDADNNSRLERANRLIEAGANIEKRIVSNGGQLMFFSHPDIVVETIRSVWDKTAIKS